VRNVSGLPGAGAALRVTIGTPGENDAFLAALVSPGDGLRSE
jgi:histidinol-phosphate/aromatic aminotransferase/cobyric acid decarboxylase-like protein